MLQTGFVSNNLRTLRQNWISHGGISFTLLYSEGISSMSGQEALQSTRRWKKHAEMKHRWKKSKSIYELGLLHGAVLGLTLSDLTSTKIHTAASVHCHWSLIACQSAQDIMCWKKRILRGLSDSRWVLLATADSDEGKVPSHHALPVCLVISQLSTSFMETEKMDSHIWLAWQVINLFLTSHATGLDSC